MWIYQSNVMTITEQLRQQNSEFLTEDAKFVAGNAAAGTRKALGKLGKAVKARRNEYSQRRKRCKVIEKLCY